MSLIPLFQSVTICCLLMQVPTTPQVVRREAVTIRSEGFVISAFVPKGWYSENINGLIRLLSVQPGLQWSRGGFPQNGAIVLIRASRINVKPLKDSLQDDSVRLQIESILGLDKGKHARLLGIKSKNMNINGNPTIVDVYEIEHAFKLGDGTEVSFGFVWLMGGRLLSLEIAFLRPGPSETQHIATAEAVLASLSIRH